MVKITSTEVSKVSGAPAAEGGLGQFENIVKGINQLFDNYWRLQGKTPPAQLATASNSEPKVPFSEARAAKKAEMAEKVKQPANIPAQGTEFQELLVGLIKTAQTLEQMGYGKKPIGQVIQELPFSLSQGREFLEQLYKTKYGG